jgi:hypothetical protein
LPPTARNLRLGQFRAGAAGHRTAVGLVALPRAFVQRHHFLIGLARRRTGFHAGVDADDGALPGGGRSGARGVLAQPGSCGARERGAAGPRDGGTGADEIGDLLGGEVAQQRRLGQHLGDGGHHALRLGELGLLLAQEG